VERAGEEALNQKAAADRSATAFKFPEGSSENKTAAITGGRLRIDHRDEEFSSLAGLAATYSSKS
jgi:hypothetical protein